MTPEELTAAVRWLAPYQGTASPTEPLLAAVERLVAAYEAERTEILDVLETERAFTQFCGHRIAQQFFSTDGVKRSTFVVTTENGWTLRIEVVDHVIVKAEVTT